MRKFLFATLVCVGLVACSKPSTFIDPQPQKGACVENFDAAISSGNYVYGYVGEHLRFRHFYNEEYAYWGGFAQSKCFDTDLANGTFENQYSVYNEAAASGDGFLLYYYDAYNEPCDIEFRRSGEYAFASVKLNLSTYTLASITNEDINAFARAFTDDDYLKVVFTPIDDEKQEVVAQRVECYVVDYRDGKRFVADSWNEFDLSAIKGDHFGIRVVVETTDVGEWGANTPLYICLDDLKYSIDE